MARRKGPRLRIELEAQRVAVKTYAQSVWSHLRHGYGLSPRLAEALAGEALAYLSGLACQRLPEQLRVALPKGRSNHSRKCGTGDTQPVVLTPCTFDPDLVVLSSQGVKALQNARLIRLVREAWFQETVMVQELLAALCNMTMKTLGARLRYFRSLGIRLPTLGESRAQRDRPCFDYSTQVLRALVDGQPAVQVERWFCASPSLLDRFVHQLRRVRYYAQRNHGAREISSLIREPTELVLEYLELIDGHRGQSHFELLIPNQLPSAPGDAGLSDTVRFLETLQQDYGLARAEATLLHHDLLIRFGPEAFGNRGDGQVVFFATRSTEPAGKPLCDCELVPVILDFFTDEDRVDESVDARKRRRIQRYTQQTQAQGGYLTHGELAYLLGVSSAVIGRLQATPEDDKVIPFPTRGREVDMGRSLTHRTQILELWMQIHTETEIVRRTGHSYSSVENYVLSFGRFALLKDREMPLPMIRKVLGCSMQLVQAYDELYAKYNTEDYWYRFELLRARVLRDETAAQNATPAGEKKTLPLRRKEVPSPCRRPSSIGLCATRT